jgi:hypothetical protein
MLQVSVLVFQCCEPALLAPIADSVTVTHMATAESTDLIQQALAEMTIKNIDNKSTNFQDKVTVFQANELYDSNIECAL